MSVSRVLRTEDGKDPSIKLIRAQVAYQLLKGLTQDQVMEWWRKEKPGESLSLLYEALDEAELQAERARKYRALKELKKPFCLGDCLEK